MVLPSTSAATPHERSYVSQNLLLEMRSLAQRGDLAAARRERARPVERAPPPGALARLGEVEPQAPVPVVLGDRFPEALSRGAEVPFGELRFAEELPPLVRPRRPPRRPSRRRLRVSGVAASERA